MPPSGCCRRGWEWLRGVKNPFFSWGIYFQSLEVVSYHTSIMGRPQCCTVILFLENGNYIFCFRFSPSILNKSSWIFNNIWCTKWINEEPLFKIFRKLKKKFPNFPDFPKSFPDLMKKKIFFDSSKLLQYQLGGILLCNGPTIDPKMVKIGLPSFTSEYL